MSKNIAISVKGVSKTFKIPHEKISSLRGAFTGFAKQLISSPPVRRGGENVPDSSSPWMRGGVPKGQRGVTGGYELFKALNNVSFEVKKGEFFGIIGRNGSGKSTLLKILAHIYRPDKGSVKINGMISPFLELGIGFNPELSGWDNVYLNATVLGMTKKQIDEKFDSIVAFSELERFIDQKLKNYSSGMQVRLAFSVSIHANRDILLMDEVLAVGDSNFQSKCLEEFNKYRDAGRTVIIVTHDISVVQRYCDRAMLLRNGKIKMIGKAEKVANEYIYDNMSDEEERMSEATSDKRQTTSENGSDSSVIPASSSCHSREGGNPSESEPSKLQKVAEITRVEFLDKDGNKKNVFQTGECIQVVVSNKFYRDVDNPIFGIIVKDSFHKIPVFVTNTRFAKIQTGKMVKGIEMVTYKIKNCFGSGNYTISPAIADKDGKKFYDWRDDMVGVKIINLNPNSSGLVEVPHSIFLKSI